MLISQNIFVKKSESFYFSKRAELLNFKYQGSFICFFKFLKGESSPRSVVTAIGCLRSQIQVNMHTKFSAIFFPNKVRTQLKTYFYYTVRRF